MALDPLVLIRYSSNVFDSHAHVASSKFDDDREAVFQRAREAGIKGWIEIGTDVVRSRRAIALAEQHLNIWASVGVHPDEVTGLTDNDWREIEQLLEHPKVVGIGEIGLDYYRDGKKETQLPALRRFLVLARDHDLPVIFHVRNGESNANDDLIELLTSLPETERPRGVLHMFSGSVDQAQAYLDLGYYISFSGVVTFKNAGVTPEVAKIVPLDRLLIETDSPFVAPEPNRGTRNEPAYVRFVAEKIAELKGMSLEEVDQISERNVQALFRLPG